jgi:hypothetical protein
MINLIKKGTCGKELGDKIETASKSTASGCGKGTVAITSSNCWHHKRLFYNVEDICSRQTE